MKPISLTLLVLLMGCVVFAQNQQPSKSTIIQGNLWPSPNDTIYIIYYPFKLGSTRIGAVVEKQISSDGSFRTEIPPMNNPYYCSIESARWGRLTFIDQLVEPGDSLMIKAGVTDQKKTLHKTSLHLVITGRNAAKNQLQYLFTHAFRFNRVSGLISVVYGQHKKFSDALTVTEKNFARLRYYWDSLQTANALVLPDKISKLFLLDFEAMKIKQLLSVYGDLYKKISVNEPSAFELQQLEDDYKKIIDPLVQQLIAQHDFSVISPDFLNMAIQKIIVDARRQHRTQKVLDGISYLNAAQQWPPGCREEISTALVSYFFTYSFNVNNIADMLLAIKPMVNKPLLKSIVQNFSRQYLPGSPILPFRLTGINGESIDSKNYKDKIIVLDFWFTGCRACIQMTKVLKIVKERMGNDPDIVFISVSIDKDTATWLGSVKEEIYTHSDFINAYTNGDGIEHPLIKYYNISAYPRLLVIGKGNRLFTSNPHIPGKADEIDLLVRDILNAKTL